MSTFNLENALQLLRNGYEPLAAKGKVTVVGQWSTVEINEDQIRATIEAWPDATNIGLRSGHLVPIDIDVYDPAQVPIVIDAIEKVLGTTPLHRRGLKGMQLFYRIAEPVPKITVLTNINDKIEILGKGQQTIAFGIHPETEQPYEWIKQTDFEETATPLNSPLETLPLITAEALETVASACRDCLVDLGFDQVRIRHSFEASQRHRTVDAAEDDPDNIARAVQYLVQQAAQGHVAIINQCGSDTIYELGCLLRDRWFLSLDVMKELVLKHWYPSCIPNDLEEECCAILAHAVEYMQNEAGATVVPSVRDTFREALKGLPADILSSPEGTPKFKSEIVASFDPDYDIDDSPHKIDRKKPALPLRELVPTWIERNENIFLEGPPGTHKSRNAVQDAISVYNGISIMGQPVNERVECLYLNYEETEEELKRRITSICYSLQSPEHPEISTDGLDVWELRNKHRPILMAARNGLVLTAFGRRVLKALEGRQGHTLVVFDNLTDAIMFNEGTRNDETIALGIIRLIDMWTIEYNFTALSILHPSRSAERNNSMGSYATSWTSRPRCIQVYKKVLNPFSGHPAKTKVDDEKVNPRTDIWFERKVLKRSHGPEGDRMWLEFHKGGLRPHYPPKPRIIPRAAPAEPEPEPEPEPETSELEF